MLLWLFRNSSLFYQFDTLIWTACFVYLWFRSISDEAIDCLRSQVAALSRALQTIRNSNFHRTADEVSKAANRLRALNIPKNPGWLLKATNNKEDSLPQEHLDIRQKIYELTKRINQVRSVRVVSFCFIQSICRIPVQSFKCGAVLLLFVYVA